MNDDAWCATLLVIADVLPQATSLGRTTRRKMRSNIHVLRRIKSRDVLSSSSSLFLHPTTRTFPGANTQVSTNSVVCTGRRHGLSTDSSWSAKGSLTGDECYERAMHALEQAKLEKERLSKERAEEQFEAWRKAQQHQDNRHPKSTGVAIIKTIAKQARQESNSTRSSNEWAKKARIWMEKAALEYGHAKALVRLGNDALDQARKSLSPEEENKERQFVETAIGFYKTAGEKGSAEGWYNLGQLLWTGYHPSSDRSALIVSPDRSTAFKAFSQAIKLGDRDAMFFVGVQLLSDDDDGGDWMGMEHDQKVGVQLVERYRQGLDLMERAASLEHGGALYYLALLHLNGHAELRIPKCSPEDFRRRLELAAATGDSDALFLRGHSFYHGEDGYDQDYQQALQTFLQAAQSGHSDAAVSAGAMLHQGVGVPKDQRRAFELYQMAGELGNNEGWRNVVACYAMGEGVPQSREMAEYIYKTVLQTDDERQSPCR